jgi:hypothetical protein
MESRTGNAGRENTRKHRTENTGRVDISSAFD